MKDVEGMKREVLYSHEKEKRRSLLLYCKMRVRDLQEKVVDRDLMQRRKERATIDHIGIDTLEEVE